MKSFHVPIRCRHGSHDWDVEGPGNFKCWPMFPSLQHFQTFGPVYTDAVCVCRGCGVTYIMWEGKLVEVDYYEDNKSRYAGLILAIQVASLTIFTLCAAYLLLSFLS